MSSGSGSSPRTATVDSCATPSFSASDGGGVVSALAHAGAAAPTANRYVHPSASNDTTPSSASTFVHAVLGTRPLRSPEICNPAASKWSVTAAAPPCSPIQVAFACLPMP